MCEPPSINEGDWDWRQSAIFLWWVWWERLRFFVRFESFSWDKHRAASLRCRVALACFSLGSDVEWTKRFFDSPSGYKEEGHVTRHSYRKKRDFALSKTNKTRFPAWMKRENWLVSRLRKGREDESFLSQPIFLQSEPPSINEGGFLFP